MAEPAQMRTPVTALLPQYLYELRKGVRPLFLLTMSCDEARDVVQRLARDGVAWHGQQVGEHKVNLFFGQPAPVATVRWLVDRPLNQLSPEADFMLGTLLGYACEQQCQRYLERVGAATRCGDCVSSAAAEGGCGAAPAGGAAVVLH